LIAFCTFIPAYVQRDSEHDLAYWLLFMLIFIIDTVLCVMNAYNNITWVSDTLLALPEYATLTILAGSRSLVVRGSHPRCTKHPHRHLWCLDTPFVCLHLEMLSSVAYVLGDLVYSNDLAALEEAVIQDWDHSRLYSTSAHLIGRIVRRDSTVQNQPQHIPISPVDLIMISE
jgi:hypothetical protein